LLAIEPILPDRGNFAGHRDHPAQCSGDRPRHGRHSGATDPERGYPSAGPALIGRDGDSIAVNDSDKWVELARLRQRVQNLEDDLGLEMRTLEPATGNHTLDVAIQALVADHAGDVIAVHAASGDFEFVTPSITPTFGYRAEKLIGRNGYDLVHPDDLDRVAASHAHLIEGPQTIEYRMRTADGGWRWVESRGQALMMGSSLSRVVVITRDVHTRKLAQLDLERSNADLRNFALVAAHDLHEPLRIVASFTDLLARRYRDALDERGLGYLEFIETHVARMRGLIDGLLAVTRVEADRSRFAIVSMKAVIDAVRTDASVAFEEADATVEVGPLPVVIGERHDGKVWAESRPGVGTTICVQLPSQTTSPDLGVPSR